MLTTSAPRIRLNARFKISALIASNLASRRSPDCRNSLRRSTISAFSSARNSAISAFSSVRSAAVSAFRSALVARSAPAAAS